MLSKWCLFHSVSGIIRVFKDVNMRGGFSCFNIFFYFVQRFTVVEVTVDGSFRGIQNFVLLRAAKFVTMTGLLQEAVHSAHLHKLSVES